MTGALAYALIEQQFPELKPFALKRLGAGWDNTVFLLQRPDSTANGSPLVFRFPRRSLAVPLFASELKVLKKINLPINTPIPLFEGVPTRRFPHPFVGYTHVPGETACRANVEFAQRHQWVKPLAQALRVLHDDAIPEGLVHDDIQRADLNYRLPRLQQQLADARSLGIDLPENAIANFVQHLQSDNFQTAYHAETLPQRLLHGDLYIRHLMVNTHGELTGFIDWGDTHQGHIATDLGVVYSCLPPHTHSSFWKHYGPVSEVTQDLARFRALYSCLYITVYGVDIQDKDLVREGIQGLKWFGMRC